MAPELNMGCRRTLEPIRKLLFGLMRYDDARYSALMSDEEQHLDRPVKGFMSRNAEIYLVDSLHFSRLHRD